MILVGILTVFLAVPVVGLQPRSAVQRPKVKSTWDSHDDAKNEETGHISSLAKKVSVSAGAGLTREDVLPGINNGWSDTSSQAEHVDVHHSVSAAEAALYLGQSGNVSATLLAIEWTVIVVLLVVIALLIRNIIEKRSAQWSEEHRAAKDQMPQPARQAVVAWPFGPQTAPRQHGSSERSQLRVDSLSYSPGAIQKNTGSPPLTRAAVDEAPKDRYVVDAEVLRAEVAGLAALEAETRLQNLEASVTTAEEILVSGGGHAENLWQVLNALRTTKSPQEGPIGCLPTMLPPPQPSSPWSASRLPTPTVTAQQPNPPARQAIERQPDSERVPDQLSLPAKFEGPFSDIDVTTLTSTVVTLSGNPHTNLNGVYGFQSWMCQRPQFANGADGVLYHDGEHWKVRAGAIPPGQAAAAASFVAWIRSLEALPPEGDWLNFSESGDISSITRVGVSLGWKEVVGALSPTSSAASTETQSAVFPDPSRACARDVPAELMVFSPTKQVAFAGLYQLVSDQYPNGCPVWKHQDHDRYLYSGVNGKWHFGAIPEKEKGFFCSRGFILHPSRHNGLMPSRLPRGEWKAYTGITHETDPSIEVNEFVADARDSSVSDTADAAARPEPQRPEPTRARTPEPTRAPAALSPGQAGGTGRPPRPGVRP